MDNEEIIIVYKKKRADISHLLAQLISAYTDHEAAEWEVKDWEANKSAIPTSQKVIFLGSAGDSYKLGINWDYKKFSMKYGWLGNRCVIDVGILDLGKVGAFKKYYKERAERFKHLADTAKGGEYDWLIIIGGLFYAPFILISSILLDRTILKQYQYQLVICEFVLEGGFKKFMEA